MEPTETITTEPVVEQTGSPLTDPVVPEVVPESLAEPGAAVAAAAAAVAAPAVEPTPEAASEPESPTEPEPAEAAPEALVVPKPSEYVLPEGMPDNIRIFAHEHGFTQKQLEASLQQFGGYVTGSQQAEQQALKEAGETHMRNWGDNAKTNLNLAKQALKQNDPEGKLAEALETSGYGNHPAVLNFLHTIGKSMQEGGYLKSTVPVPPGKQDVATAMYGDSITKKP